MPLPPPASVRSILSAPRLVRAACAACVVAAVGACADAARQEGPQRAPRVVVARAGGWQAGEPGQPLGSPLVVAVLDAAGAPVQDAAVRWSVDDGGVVQPAESRTDANGEARATWTLGDATPHQAHARAGSAMAATFAALVDGRGALVALDVATYDGSGQVVHPDVAAAPVGWGTGPRQLVMTPYPFGNAAFENPSLFVAPDETHWLPPAGGDGNPVVRPLGGYLSDPDLVFDPAAGALRLYYRAVDGENRVLLTTSRDGLRWDTPVEVVHGPNHTVVSPAVVRRAANDWWMWTVDGGVGCTAATAALDVRRSADGVHWSAPTRATLAQAGYFPWHVDVQWIPSLGEFWALYNGKEAGSCTTPALFLARSTDGVTWTTYPSPVLARGAIAELADVVYRSTFAYDPASDAVTLWYSGASYDGSRYVWRAAVERRTRAALLASVSSTNRIAAIPGARADVPPLTDGP
ncbi:MAG TPA: Ig-like domain-containing protein [Gemmatimonadaceae bacterium]|nr:Ig-like domain-containing protein [Gemmatimonadaceae bacterium]